MVLVKIFYNSVAAILLAALLIACDGESDEDTSQIACIEIYEPVCAKAEATINCVTEPCPTHVYATYGNSCYALHDEALVAFPGDCGRLYGQVSFNDPPIHIFELADNPQEGADTEILFAEIEGDVLKLEVQYAGGCSEHEFALYLGSEFLESNPVQSETLLSHITEDTCEQLIVDNLRFDLLPIREFYRRSYGETSSGIILRGIEFYDW